MRGTVRRADRSPIFHRISVAVPDSTPGSWAKRRDVPPSCPHNRPGRSAIELPSSRLTAQRYARTTGTADSCALAFPGASRATPFGGSGSSTLSASLGPTAASRMHPRIRCSQHSPPSRPLPRWLGSLGVNAARRTRKPTRGPSLSRAVSTPVHESTANLTPACSGLAALAADARR